MWRCVKGSGRAKEKTENGLFSLDAKRGTGSICPKGPTECQGSEGRRHGSEGLRRCSVCLMPLTFKSDFSAENIVDPAFPGRHLSGYVL